jgi:hypothetical protein
MNLDAADASAGATKTLPAQTGQMTGFGHSPIRSDTRKVGAVSKRRALNGLLVVSDTAKDLL